MEDFYVTGLILSGGRSSRMAYQDKGLVLLNGRPMIETVKNTLINQVDELIISANQNLKQYQQIHNIVLADEYLDFRGPLAGIYEGLKYIKEDTFLLVAPCDGPFLPNDLCQKMLSAVKESKTKLATVYDGRYRQPTYSLIHQSLKKDLKLFLDNDGRKLGQWLSENHTQLVDFSEQARAFININSDEDLLQIQQ
ncbi:MAG: molybdenum cofactor guanylyltransferase MobA [Pseudomonadota bacterium]